MIRKGESTEIELKRSFHSVQGIARIICAFSNTQGGLLILGAGDKGNIEGVIEDMDIIQQKISASNSLIHPSPSINIEMHTLEGKNVIIVAVHKADSSVFHSFEGAVYVKIGSTVQKLEGQSIVEFLRNRQILLFEEAVDHYAKTEDLDVNKIRQYLENRGIKEYLDSHSIEDFLKSKGFASQAPDFKIKNAALLFFSKDPQHFFPYAQIKLVRFDGTEPVKVLAYEEARGTPMDMVEHATNFVRRFVPKEFVIEGVKRKEIPALPEEAMREAVINAVAHRDYFNKNEIQISIFDDRLELTNPGGLPEGMSRELLGSLSIQRNPKIYQMLKDYGYMEGIGSGISKIYRAMRESNFDDPMFVLAKDFFRIVLKIGRTTPKTDGDLRNSGLNERQVKTILYVKEKGRITNREYREITGLSDEGVRIDIAGLVEKNIFEIKGKGRSTYYVLKVGV